MRISSTTRARRTECQPTGDRPIKRRLNVLPSAPGAKRADKTEISWTHAKGYIGRTWNPTTGCQKVSPGCKNCYANVFAERFRGVIQPNGKEHPFFNGFNPMLRPERIDEPRSWRSPQMVFVNSMSDLFLEFFPDEYLDRVFATMRETPQHIYQVLTKRAERLAEYTQKNPWLADAKHIWLGVSAEDREYGLPRIDLLREATAAVKFLSIEPLLESLGTIDLTQIQWVIGGGESGPKARPMDPDWAREVRDQCIASGVPFFFKQWGQYGPKAGSDQLFKLGKKRSGHVLDGRTWDEFPCGVVADSVEVPPHGEPAPEQDAEDESAATHQDEPARDEDCEDESAPDDEPPESRDEADDPGENGESALERDTAPEPAAPPGPDDGDAGVDPRDGRGVEDELERLITSLTEDLSELAVVKLLPRAKALYEKLHPETKHGGSRDEQLAKSATWPSFADYVAARAGLSKRTVYNRLEQAESLGELDPAAEAGCYGSPLANQVGLLVRIAALPKAELHGDVVNIYRSAGPKKAKEELRKWEDEFGLAKKPNPTPDATPEPAEPTESTEPTERAYTESDLTNELAEIMLALGVNMVEDCVPAIEALKLPSTSPSPHDLEQVGALQATIHELQALLRDRDARAEKLEQELALFRKTPLGELFRTLGATTVKDALRKARKLTEANHAAE